MMLRIQCLQQWFGMSDLETEESLFETNLYRDFLGISVNRRITNRVSIPRVRPLLDEDEHSPKILQVINTWCASHGQLLRTASVENAALITMPSPSKNKEDQRDPEGQQVRNGNQYHFAMKVQSGSKLIAVSCTPSLLQRPMSTTSLKNTDCCTRLSPLCLPMQAIKAP